MVERKVLPDKTRTILIAVMNAIIPRGGPFYLGAADLTLVPRVEDILARLGSPARKIFSLMLAYVEYSTILKTGRLFTGLSPTRAGEILAGLEKSPFLHSRQLIMVLKTLTLMVFFERDEIADMIGYDHGCHIAMEEEEGRHDSNH